MHHRHVYTSSTMCERCNTWRRWLIGLALHTLLVLTVCTGYLPMTILSAVFVLGLDFSRQEWAWIFAKPVTCARDHIKKAYLLMCYVCARPGLLAYIICLLLEHLPGAPTQGWRRAFTQFYYIFTYVICRVVVSPYYTARIHVEFHKMHRPQLPQFGESLASQGNHVGHAA